MQQFISNLSSAIGFLKPFLIEGTSKLRWVLFSWFFKAVLLIQVWAMRLPRLTVWLWTQFRIAKKVCSNFANFWQIWVLSASLSSWNDFHETPMSLCHGAWWSNQKRLIANILSDWEEFMKIVLFSILLKVLKLILLRISKNWKRFWCFCTNSFVL